MGWKMKDWALGALSKLVGPAPPRLAQASAEVLTARSGQRPLGLSGPVVAGSGVIWRLGGRVGVGEGTPR
jgi:hypothetical protein